MKICGEVRLVVSKVILTTQCSSQFSFSLAFVLLLLSEDTKLPCRTAIKVEGAEWFIYNRNPAFDMLLERLGHREADALGGKRRQEGHDKDSVRILPPSNDNHMANGEQTVYSPAVVVHASC